jgi:hypothetical protein
LVLLLRIRRRNVLVELVVKRGRVRYEIQKRAAAVSENPGNFRTTYNMPLRVESVEMDEALKAWQAVEPANGMHFSVAMVV